MQVRVLFAWSHGSSRFMVFARPKRRAFRHGGPSCSLLDLSDRKRIVGADPRGDRNCEPIAADIVPVLGSASLKKGNYNQND